MSPSSIFSFFIHILGTIFIQSDNTAALYIDNGGQKPPYTAYNLPSAVKYSSVPGMAWLDPSTTSYNFDLVHLSGNGQVLITPTTTNATVSFIRSKNENLVLAVILLTLNKVHVSVGAFAGDTTGALHIFNTTLNATSIPNNVEVSLGVYSNSTVYAPSLLSFNGASLIWNAGSMVGLTNVSISLGNLSLGNAPTLTKLSATSAQIPMVL